MSYSPVKESFCGHGSLSVLKANQNIMLLQEELVSTENRIGFARQLYNDLVANYRIMTKSSRIRSLPPVFVIPAPDFFTADKLSGLSQSDCLHNPRILESKTISTLL